MASYKVEIKRSAQKELRSLPLTVRRALVKRIMKLEADPRPRGVEKLHGAQDLYRVRQGSYRVVYEVHDKAVLVMVIKVGHRKDIYKN